MIALHEEVGVLVPDGITLVWVTRSRGHRQARRISAGGLVDAAFSESARLGHRQYFHRERLGIADRFATALQNCYPGLKISGEPTPPFRPLAEEKSAVMTKKIVKSRPNIVWGGLSTPPQEFWMRDHARLIVGANLLGFGAAIDFHTADVNG